MNFQLLGLNHRSAPLDVRERLAISEARLGEALAQLVRYSGVKEALILSTCNRMELVAYAPDGYADLRGFLREYLKVDPKIYEPALYEYRAQDAVRHVFRVASSLDSMVIGEPQILGQVKEAYATARAMGTINSQLDVLLTRAFAVAKRIRTETAVANSTVSVASVAVDLAKKIFGDLSGKVIYLVGAGKMTELAARHLAAHGAGTMFVANRTFERAEQLARRFHGKALLFEQLYDTVDQADIVITSTGAPHAVFRRSHCELFLARRKNRPMFFIDIAVPRDVDPEVNKLDGIFLYDIDDLQTVVSSHAADRSREASRAEEIIAEEVVRFAERVQTQQVVPAIVSLQAHLETIRQAEIDRVRGRLGTLSPEQELAIDALTRGIVNKVMHTPIRALKTAAREQQATTVLDVFRRIFNLDNNLDNVGNLESPPSRSLTRGSVAGDSTENGLHGSEEDRSLGEEISASDPAPESSKERQASRLRASAAGKQGRC
jgi:glutamyl-tRNA reductase